MRGGTAAAGRAGLVVRLELPTARPLDLLSSDDARSPGPSASADVPDLARLARAIQDLVAVAAPGVVAEIAVVDDPPPAPRTLSLASSAEPHLDLGSRTLTVDGSSVLLTRREFDLLAYLMRRRAVALSRRELMTAVWQTGYLVGDRTIDVHIRRLRVKLGRHADRLTTLRGYGYRYD